MHRKIIMRLLLFRHAETAWSLSGQHTGKTDIGLTEAGIAQARATAPLFRRLLGEGSLDALYASPRARALATAELALGPGASPIVTDLLAEFDYGDYEGLTAAEIRERAPGWNFWNDGCPGGETFAEVSARADRFIELLRARPPEQTICAVSHGHMIRILTARLLRLSARQGSLFDIKTASIAEFVDKNGDWVLARWNLTQS
jgi:broad specificity phosphatase PhoE